MNVSLRNSTSELFGSPFSYTLLGLQISQSISSNLVKVQYTFLKLGYLYHQSLICANNTGDRLGNAMNSGRVYPKPRIPLIRLSIILSKNI